MPGLPNHCELTLTDAVAYPVKAHVGGLGAALCDRVIGYSSCDRVVSGDGSWLLLWMSKISEGVSQWCCRLAVLEQAAIFGFRGCADDRGYDFAVGQDASIYEIGGAVIAEVEESTCS